MGSIKINDEGLRLELSYIKFAIVAKLV